MRYRYKQKRIFEISFFIILSALVLVLFFSLISMNGLVLGNDPAVHLEKAQIFLQTERIPLENLGWTPPLYQIFLAMLISFTGATGFEQYIFLVKAGAVLIDWLLVFSVYLLGTKFFGRKIGGIAAILLLLCFPMYEMNLWGGYTTVLGLSFLFLLFVYLPLASENFGHILITFLVGFSLVLSHQLATFVTVLILPPVMLYMLIKSRGTYLKALIALILGGGIAFFLYYFQAMIPYLDMLIEHVVYSQKTTLYQIPATTLNAFLVNFGFILFFAIIGIFISFFTLRAKKKPIFYLLLFLSFVVPFALAESYLVGLYLPFQWFIYYLMPAMVVLAAVAFVSILNWIRTFYAKNTKKWRSWQLKAIVFFVVVLMSAMLVFRFGTVYGKVMEGSIFYSTSDLKAYEAGVWLKNNFPEPTTVVVTSVPGFWFRIYSGKTVIAETDPVVQRTEIAEAVLDLSYEIEHPHTLVRVYEAKGDISEESFVSINHVWRRVSYSAGDGSFISYSEQGIDREIPLSDLKREIIFESQTSLKKLMIQYFNDELSVNQTIVLRNDSYAIDVAWAISSLKREISNVSLYVSSFFDLQFSFQRAYIPGMLNWENPWSKPSNSHGNDWAVVNYSSSTLTDNYLGFIDDKEENAYALKFDVLPDWGNVGALASMQIDALRFQYDFDEIRRNQTVAFKYQVLTFSQSSYPEFQNENQIESLFASKPTGSFDVQSRNYHDFVIENRIEFIVYDKNQLDTKMINSKLLKLVFSNDRYVIFRINYAALSEMV